MSVFIVTLLSRVFKKMIALGIDNKFIHMLDNFTISLESSRGFDVPLGIFLCKDIQEGYRVLKPLLIFLMFSPFCFQAQGLNKYISQKTAILWALGAIYLQFLFHCFLWIISIIYSKKSKIPKLYSNYPKKQVGSPYITFLASSSATQD